ncbi:hypothetical protein G6N82_06785 [Altererythrobacter sp. BO-6]|uniref:hypothetical protein n=1 Tax=Altererythrobacter sp. BO-6 TaxID=2604537 RepID=UPI0013E136EB|nr:hypothetical protein [Altererythrobacter sp. BO-6]QIG53899.1 hypothetical protein G6N82_06785 [Altererythrobacter sp. BO-6]
MRRFRHYRGLNGETIPVAEDTIAATALPHRHEPFPFMRAAQRAGKERDQLAFWSQHFPWIDDTLKLPSVRRMLVR